jgi:hypothetical protein
VPFPGVPEAFHPHQPGLTKNTEFTLCDELFNEQQKNCERELMLYSKFAN